MSNFYESIYLCLKTKDNEPFACKEFKSFEDASNWFFTNKIEFAHESTMIPICKFMPNFLKSKVLHKKLSERFIKTPKLE